MKAIVGAWKTLTDSFGIVGRYRSYSVYPLLSLKQANESEQSC